MYTMYHILPSKLPNFVHCPVWTALCEKSSNIRINFLNFTLLETNLWAWMNVCECSLPLTAKVDGLTSKQEIDSWMVETVLHSTRGGEIKLNEISSQKWDIHLDIFIFIYSIASTCANGQMLLWMNRQANFFQGLFWDLAVWILAIQRHAHVQCGDIVNSETRTTSMLRYWKFKDIHCSLATASQGALSDRWLKGAWMAARYVFSSTVCMVWYCMGDLAGRYIRRTLVLGGHTIRMGGRRYTILWFGNVNCYYDYE